jgi:hypothetical protein
MNWWIRWTYNWDALLHKTNATDAAINQWIDLSDKMQQHRDVLNWDAPLHSTNAADTVINQWSEVSYEMQQQMKWT